MPDWTATEEERITKETQEILNNPYPRIRSNRLRKLRRGIENYKASAKRHQHDLEANKKFRREIKILNEIIDRVEKAQLATDEEGF